MKIIHIIILLIVIAVLAFAWFVRPREISADEIIIDDISVMDGQITSSGKTFISIKGLVGSSSYGVAKIVEQETEEDLHIKILIAPIGIFGVKSGSINHPVIMPLGLSRRVTIGKEKVEIYPNNNFLLE